MTVGGRNIFLNVQLELIILLSKLRLVANRTTGSPLCRGRPFEGLEPCDGKLSSTVLRGLGGSNAPLLPGIWGNL